MYYRKPTLKNLSQGARLEYVRRLRHMNEDKIISDDTLDYDWTTYHDMMITKDNLHICNNI